MTDIPLVSIIAPIYNVEAYLVLCLESLINQSHDNIEILLINDGSTDKSGIIADEYAKIDSRVRVFHCENNGVSVARNLGLEHSEGDYVVFVDSDDILSIDFTKDFLSAILKTDADFAYGKNVALRLENLNVGDDQWYLKSPEDVTCEFLYPDIIIGCWNKMYKKRFLLKNKIKFSSNFYMGEGLNFITTTSQVARKIVAVNKALYFYRTDNISSATKKFNIDKFDNALSAIDNIKNNLILNTKNVLLALDFHYWWTNFYSLQSIVSSGEEFRYKDRLEGYSNYLKSNAFSVLPSKVSTLMKLKIILIRCSPILVAKSIVRIKNFLR